MSIDVAVVHLGDELYLRRREPSISVPVMGDGQYVTVSVDIRVVLWYPDIHLEYSALVWRSLRPRKRRAPHEYIRLIGCQGDVTQRLLGKVCYLQTSAI